MAKIFKYRKVTDEFTTHALREPDSRDGDDRITELCTIHDETYVCVPDGVELPEQPDIIQQTLQPVNLVDVELKKQLGAASPHKKLINRRVVNKIREKYSLEEELQMLRTGPTDESKAYFDYCGACVAWGKAQKAKLGL